MQTFEVHLEHPQEPHCLKFTETQLGKMKMGFGKGTGQLLSTVKAEEN